MDISFNATLASADFKPNTVLTKECQMAIQQDCDQDIQTLTILLLPWLQVGNSSLQVVSWIPLVCRKQ